MPCPRRTTKTTRTSVYIRCKKWSTEGGERRSYGPYLMLFSHEWDVGTGQTPKELRALVRSVRMGPRGGLCKVKLPEEDELLEIRVSGSFGNDGLPLTVPKNGGIGILPSRLWPLLPEVPGDLSKQFWTSSESEVLEDFRRWAERNMRELRRLIKPETFTTLT